MMRETWNIWAYTNLGGFDAFREWPSGHDVVDESFSERLGNAVNLHELLDVVEHLVVARWRRVHLLEDRCYVTEDRSVQ